MRSRRKTCCRPGQSREAVRSVDSTRWPCHRRQRDGELGLALLFPALDRLLGEDHPALVVEGWVPACGYRLPIQRAGESLQRRLAGRPPVQEAQGAQPLGRLPRVPLGNSESEEVIGQDRRHR